MADGGHAAYVMAASIVRRSASILVVDDEEIMREILEALLTREGYKVRLASSGEEGLERVKVIAVRQTFDRLDLGTVVHRGQR